MPMEFEATSLESEDRNCLLCSDHVEHLEISTKDTTSVVDRLPSLGSAMEPEGLE